VVVKIANDPPATSAKSGLGEFGDDLNVSHFPFTNGVVYCDWGTDTRKTTVDPTPSLTGISLLNVVSKSGEWTLRLNGTEIYTTASNNVVYSATPKVGKEVSGFGDVFLDGHLFEIVFFPTVRTAGERDTIENDLGAVYGQSW